jgi:hypothetical protein
VLCPIRVRREQKADGGKQAEQGPVGSIDSYPGPGPCPPAAGPRSHRAFVCSLAGQVALYETSISSASTKFLFAARVLQQLLHGEHSYNSRGSHSIITSIHMLRPRTRCVRSATHTERMAFILVSFGIRRSAKAHRASALVADVLHNCTSPQTPIHGCYRSLVLISISPVKRPAPASGPRRRAEKARSTSQTPRA